MNINRFNEKKKKKLLTKNRLEAGSVLQKLLWIQTTLMFSTNHKYTYPSQIPAA